MKNQESKRKILYLAFALMMTIAMTSTATAKSWRINNNTSLKPHFTDINTAMSSDEVQDGDTLYLDPGCTLSSTQTVSKAVIVVGPGYFLDALPYNQASIDGYLSLNAEKCKVMGLSANKISINNTNITIERCKSTYIGGGYSNATIRSCYVYYSATGSVIDGSSNWTIENCIIVGRHTNYTFAGCISNCVNSTIRNNYIYQIWNENYSKPYASGIYGCSGCEITNNIIIAQKSASALVSNTNCIVTNNILSYSYTDYPNNKVSTNSEVLVSSGSNDLAYKLSSTSPAKGYATDGGDCGPYGSGYTYVPSGIPFGHPYYTQIQVGSPAQKGKLNVTYKVKVQDE